MIHDARTSYRKEILCVWERERESVRLGEWKSRKYRDHASKCNDIFLTCLYHRCGFMCTMNWKWSCLTANDVFPLQPMRFHTLALLHTHIYPHKVLWPRIYMPCNSTNNSNANQRITYLRQNENDNNTNKSQMHKQLWKCVYFHSYTVYEKIKLLAIFL